LTLRLADFDFDLPAELIARHPADPRDSARLLFVSAGLQDRRVGDLPNLLRPGDLMIFNDTKVIPAQLSGRREGRPGGSEAKIEVTLHKREGPDLWRAFAKPARRVAPHERIRFGEDFWAEVRAKTADG
jgi:S-adenosylmethionine:tRNA ribosyltransferase-isomerase